MAEDRHDLKTATRGTRRWVFWLWVALTVAIALYIAIAAPFTEYFGEGMYLVAVVGVPLMVVLLGLGLGWLIWVASARDTRRRPPKDRRPPS